MIMEKVFTGLDQRWYKVQIRFDYETPLSTEMKFTFTYSRRDLETGRYNTLSKRPVALTDACIHGFMDEYFLEMRKAAESAINGDRNV